MEKSYCELEKYKSIIYRVYFIVNSIFFKIMDKKLKIKDHKELHRQLFSEEYDYFVDSYQMQEIELQVRAQ